MLAQLLIDWLPTLLGGGGLAAVIAPLFMKVLGFLANKVTGGRLQIDDQQRAVVEKAIENAIGFAIARRAEKDPAANPSAPLSADDLAAAKSYLEEQIPETLTHFGIGTRSLGELVVSRWGKMLMRRVAQRAA